MTALIVACGALAREVIELRARNAWDAKVVALPASLHNTPDRIPDAVERRVAQERDHFRPVVVVYGDCGTGGGLAALLRERGWRGLSAPHCYAAFAGRDEFDQLMRQEPGTFFLTDYLAGSFDHLVLEGLGIDRFPELAHAYFKRYRRIVYLRQRHDAALLEKARQAAMALKLPLEVRDTGLVALEDQLEQLLARTLEPSMKVNGPWKRP